MRSFLLTIFFVICTVSASNACSKITPEEVAPLLERSLQNKSFKNLADTGLIDPKFNFILFQDTNTLTPLINENFKSGAEFASWYEQNAKSEVVKILPEKKCDDKGCFYKNYPATSRQILSYLFGFNVSNKNGCTTLTNMYLYTPVIDMNGK